MSVAEARRWMRQLFACSPDAIGVGCGMSLCVVNAAYLALYGYDDEAEALGRPYLDFIAPGARDMIVEFARRRRMGETLPASYVTRGVRRDGSEFDVEVRSTVLEIAGEIHIVTFQREVTGVRPRRRPDDDAFYRAVFDVNTAIKLLIAPTTGRIVAANQAAIDFYGWPLEVLRGMRISDINTLSESEVRQEMENACSGRRRYFRFRHRIASGEVRHVEVYSGPIELGEEQLLFSIIHDVTERDALEQQLRASQRLEAVGRLAGGIAHEFNNLLTVVLTASEMIARRSGEASPVKPYVDDLGHAARRAAELTRELLAFSRRQVMQPECVDLNGVVSDMAALLQRTLGASLEIELDLVAPSLETRVDPRQIEHVLMNLVLNARDAMPQGGRILISTATSYMTAADSSIVPPGRWATLRVRDEGEGMDAETQARIFEPYFTTRADGRGTGLGLATVYGIVTQSGGYLTVASEPGGGTEFTVYLPIVATSAPPSSRRVDPARHHRDARVLLVEDIEAVRRTLSHGLEAVGFRVLQAGSSDEALSVLSREKVDVLVSDIVLPGMSGVDLVLTILESRPALPAVVISGDLRGHDLSRLPKRVRALQKPLTAGRLVAAIDASLAAGEKSADSGPGDGELGEEGASVLGDGPAGEGLGDGDGPGPVE